MSRSKARWPVNPSNISLSSDDDGKIDWYQWSETLWSVPREHLCDWLIQNAEGLHATLSRELRTAAAASQRDFAQVTAVLAKTIKHADVEVRGATVSLLLKFYHECFGDMTLAVRGAPKELEWITSALVEATCEKDSKVRKDAMALLGVVVRVPASPVIQSLTNHIPDETDPDVVAWSLDIIMRAGLDRASVAIPVIIKLLDYSNEQVRCRACELLGKFECEARGAVDTLVRITLRETNSQRLQENAARALHCIDPSGYLAGQSRLSQPERDKLLEILRDIGPDVRSLRIALPHRWEEFDRTEHIPAGAESIWIDLTPTERDVVTAISNAREWLPVADLFPKLCWEGSTDPEKNLRTHLSNIKKKLCKRQLSPLWERENKRIRWLAQQR